MTLILELTDEELINRLKEHNGTINLDELNTDNKIIKGLNPNHKIIKEHGFFVKFYDETHRIWIHRNHENQKIYLEHDYFQCGITHKISL